jgi:succinyl-CoA synthetase beta subunit
MRLLEHQAKKIFSSWGIPIPRSTLFSKTLTPAVLKKKVGSFPVILKAQVYAGGRGKGGGIVKIKDIKTLKTKAAALLERPLVTPQTGPGGVRVKSLLVEQGLRVQKEFYISILLDRSLGLPIMVASAEGGMSIEELAKKHPDKISRVPFDPVLGLYPFQARRIAQWMGIESSYQTAAQQQLVGLARGFLRGDASLAEINPWAVTKELGLVALDAKLTIDDNALYRHPKLQKLLTADAELESTMWD